MKTKKSLIKKLSVLAACIIIWIVGVLFFYNQYSNSTVFQFSYQTSGGEIVTEDFPATAGKSFIEDKLLELVLLTTVCTVPAFVALIKIKEVA